MQVPLSTNRLNRDLVSCVSFVSVISNVCGFAVTTAFSLVAVGTAFAQTAGASEITACAQVLICQGRAVRPQRTNREISEPFPVLFQGHHGNTRTAEQLLEEYQATRATFPARANAALQALVAMHSRNGNLKEATKYCKIRCELLEKSGTRSNSAMIECLQTLTRLLCQSGEISEARKTLDRAERIDSEMTNTAALQYGALEAQVGRKSEAKRFLTSAETSLDRLDETTRLNVWRSLASQWEQLGDSNKAVKFNDMADLLELRRRASDVSARNTSSFKRRGRGDSSDTELPDSARDCIGELEEKIDNADWSGFSHATAMAKENLTGLEEKYRVEAALRLTEVAEIVIKARKVDAGVDLVNVAANVRLSSPSIRLGTRLVDIAELLASLGEIDRAERILLQASSCIDKANTWADIRQPALQRVQSIQREIQESRAK